ncbi:hypothetical protein ACOSQ4_031570 [Xanthoceras sorbifolium]
MSRPIEEVMKEVRLSDVSESSGSSVSSKGSTDSELRPMAQVTSTRIIDLDIDNEGGPPTIIVDDIPEEIVKGEASTNQAGWNASTSGGGILPAGLSLASRLTESDLLRIRFQYGIPESVELRLLRPTKHADSVNGDWTCFYELPFLQGFRFPILALSRRVLRFFDITIGQLMPNG